MCWTNIARFHANALASEIITSNPKIATLFETWRKNGKSNAKLEENEELKSMILAETPWVNDAQSEDEKETTWQRFSIWKKWKMPKKLLSTNWNKSKKPLEVSLVWRKWRKWIHNKTHFGRMGHLAKLNTVDTTVAKSIKLPETESRFWIKKFLENHKPRTHNLKSNRKTDLVHPYTRFALPIYSYFSIWKTIRFGYSQKKQPNSIWTLPKIIG